MPAQALARTAPRPQQDLEHRNIGPDQGALPDLRQGLDPLMAARLQGVLGNEALNALARGEQGPGGGANGGASGSGSGAGGLGQVFELSRHAPTVALPHKEKMEQSFGAEVAQDVQVQQGAEAEQALDLLNAQSAYHDGVILLRRGAGPEEVGHELAHAQQEEGPSPGSGTVDQGPADGAEREAADAGRAAANGEPVGELQAGLSADVHRWGLGNLWDGAKKLVTGAADTLGEAGKTVWNTGKSAVGGAVDTVKAAGQGLWDTGKAAVGGLVDTGAAALGGVWDTAKAAGSGLLSTGSAALGGAWDTLKTAGQGTLDTLGAGWQGVKDVWGARDQGLGGMLSAAGQGLWNTGATALGGAWDTLKAGGQGLLDTAKAGGQGLWGTLSAAGGGLMDTLQTAGSGLWDTIRTAGSGALDTLKTGLSGLKDTAGTALDGLVRTALAAGKGTFDTLMAVLPPSWGQKLDDAIAGATGWTLDKIFDLWPTIKDKLPDDWTQEVLAPDTNDRLYSTGPRSTVDNKYTSAMDIPGTTDDFRQQFSPLGIPLTDEAWKMQNQIDGGELQRLHAQTLIGTLTESGVMDQLIQSGAITADQATTDVTQLSETELTALVNTIDDADATKEFFGSMDPQQFTNFQTAIIDRYMELANEDPQNSAMFLDLLPTELDGNVMQTLDEAAAGQQPNDFRAGSITSMSRQASVEGAEAMRAQGKRTYGLVVPFSNSAENIVHNNGVAEDGVSHLGNYLRQLDPSTTTMANGYSQSGNAVLHYAQRYGGTEGLDYVGAVAPMGGADTQGGNGVWAGTMRAGESDPGVQVMSLMHQDDPAQYIHTADGMTNFYWSLLNFNFTHRGQDEIHGGFPGPVPDPENGTTGYPMEASSGWMQRMFSGEFQGQDYSRRADWNEDRRKR